MKFCKRIIYLLDEIEDGSFSKTLKDLMNFSSESDEPILLVVSSSGGSVPSTLAILDAIRMIKAPVYILVICKAFSAAAVMTILAGSGRRYMTPESTLMIHGISSYARGKVDEMKLKIAITSQLQSRIEERILQNSKLTKNRLMKWSKAEKVITAKEALEYGLVDGVVTDMNQISCAPVTREKANQS